MPAYADTLTPYADTVVGADGRRYADDDPNVPSVNPRLGGFATRRELAEVRADVADIQEQLGS